MKPQEILFQYEKPDYIVVLDACRFDHFKKVNWLSGTLQKCWSLGGKTPDFFAEMRRRLDMSDYFYLTANPRAFSKTNFHDWKLLSSIDPRQSLKEIQQSLNRFDKIFFHFSPPHLPWLGEEGSKYMDELYGEGGQSPDGDIWERYVYPRVDNLIECYQENIAVGLEAVEKIKQIMGNCVVTSDHGELLGEHNDYGHFHNDPQLLQSNELREVPWFEWD